MANYCDITCEIYSDEIEKLNRLKDKLHAKIYEAERKGEGVNFGGEKYFFDLFIGSNADNSDDQLSLYGTLKWSFPIEEMTKLVVFMKNLFEGELNIHVEYEEPGSQLFGRYNYSNGSIEHHFINEHYPDYDDEDNEPFYEKLLESLDKYGIVENIAI